MNKKTITVNVQIQMDVVNDNNGDYRMQVGNVLDKINIALQTGLEENNPQVLSSGIDNSDIEVEPTFIEISGYWKDDKVEFEGMLVSDTERDDNSVFFYGLDGEKRKLAIADDDDDDSVFFYGLDEEKIKQAIADGEDSEYEFVITSYEL